MLNLTETDDHSAVRGRSLA